VPRFTGSAREVSPVVLRRSDGGIKHHRIGIHVARDGAIGEDRSRRRFNLAGAIPEKDAATTDERRADAALQLLKDAKEGVDRAPGCASRRLIDRDYQEAIIAPLARARQRFPVSLPAGEILIDCVEQLRRAFAANAVGSGEYPEAGIVRQFGK